MSRCAKVSSLVAALSALAWLLSIGGIVAQEARSTDSPPIPRTLPFGSDTFVPLPSAPSEFQTNDYKIRVVTVADGLSRPFALAFLPGGDILVTERTGQLRIIRNGVLDPRPIPGLPEVRSGNRDGLMDIAIHPNFAQNRFVYLTYTKPGDGRLAADLDPECTSSLTRTCVSESFLGPDAAGSAQAIALARGRFDGHALTDVQDLLIAEKWTARRLIPTLGSRIAFGRDGMLYMTVAAAAGDWNRSQQPGNHQGKVLRLRDDGTAPSDNPFVGKPGYKPEIYTLGHRNPLGLAIHPETGAAWVSEMGPQGGDEVDILVPGRNYGWPTVSMGRDYSGEPYPYHDSVPGFEPPTVFWAPAIGISGITFYTGDRFPRWRDSVFVGSMAYTHLERVTFNKEGQHIRREWLLLDLKQRIRDVREGPDGCLYLLTDARHGALLRIEPAE